MPHRMLGSKVALVGCEAWPITAEQPVKVSGLYLIEEWVPSDRSCGQMEPGYILVPVFDEDHKAEVFVDSDSLREQISPASYGRHLVLMREMDAAAERDWA